MKDTYTLQLILTNACNLSCRYCYVIKGKDVMPLDTAYDAIDDAVRLCAEKDLDLTVSFMGGEPMLEFKRIRKICQYTWEKYPEMDVQFHSPTNGTVLDDEIRSWLSENRERITLGLSFDGEYSQDVNRSNSCKNVDIEFFREIWPNQPLKMTVSEGGLEHLAENIIHLHEAEMPFGVNCACGEPEWDAISLKLFERQMLLLAEYYNTHDEIPPCELLNVDFITVLQERRPMLRRCGIGYNYITVCFDGKEYPCHMFSPLAMKTERLREANKYDFYSMNDFAVKGCENCKLNQTCPKCYGAQYKILGTPFLRDINLCKCFHIQAKVAAIYQIRKLKMKQNLDEADKLLLYSIARCFKTTHF